RTVEAVVCRWNANTGWLNFRPSRRRLISVALKFRTGGGQIASNSRIVTLLTAPASWSAARSPRRDSTILATMHLPQNPTATPSTGRHFQNIPETGTLLHRIAPSHKGRQWQYNKEAVKQTTSNCIHTQRSSG